MRYAVLTAASAAMLALLVPNTAVAQQDATSAAVDQRKLTVAREIVTLGYLEDMREAMFFGTMDQRMDQMNSAMLAPLGDDRDEELEAIVMEWQAGWAAMAKDILRSNIPSMMDAIAVSYANMFTLRELEDILAFVSTPSGKRFFVLSPAVIAEPNFAAANQKYLDEIMAELPEAQRDLQARILEYLATQAENQTIPS